MLVRPKRGAPLVATKVQPYTDQAPSDYSYGSTSPIAERTHAYRDLSLGFGLKVQGDTDLDHKYLNALGVDASVGGLIMKGPEMAGGLSGGIFTPATTDATNGVSSFMELGGNLYAMAGRYVLKRVSDSSWTVSKDFGAGVNVLNAATFTSGGGTPAGAVAYAALNDGNKAVYSTDGTTWTAFATFTCLDFQQVGRQLYRASDTNQLSNVDANADPTVEANWSNANSFRAGDKTSPIQRLAVTAVGSLIVLKQDGVYSIDEAGEDHRLYSGVMQFGAGADDGRYWFSFGNDLHVTYQMQHVRLVPTVSFGNPRLELQPIGPERMVENDSVVRGRVTAGLGHGSLGAYCGLYNDDTGNSFLLKFGAWIGPRLEEGKLEEAQRVDAWHGSISQTFTNKKITAMWKSTLGAPAGHYRLYLGFSTGDLSWLVLPCTPNPAACSAYRFDATTDGLLTMSQFHGTFEADAKTLRSFSVTGPVLNATNYAALNYKTDPSLGSYTALGTSFNTSPRQRADFPNNTATYLADLQLVLHNTVDTASPVLSAPALHWAVRPKLILEYTGVIAGDNGQTKRDGRPHRLGPAAIRQVVNDATQATGSVNVVFPDEQSKQVSFVDYGESITFDERAFGAWSSDVPFKCIEFVTNQQMGTWARVGIYTWNSIGAMTWGQLPGL